jgi:hypothetical protein
MHHKEVTESFLQKIETQLKSSLSIGLIELLRLTIIMLNYREELFTRLSRMEISSPQEVLNRLAELFRIEAICVGLQLSLFLRILLFVAIVATITCLMFLAFIVKHW